MTLQEYCNLLAWNESELARQAGINRRSAHKALHGQAVARVVARKIATAISDAIGKRILVGEIDGLAFQE